MSLDRQAELPTVQPTTKPESEKSPAVEGWHKHAFRLFKFLFTPTTTYRELEIQQHVGSERFQRNRENFQVIGHMGGGEDMPESTMLAFEEALNNGADFLDLDLYQTKDGHLVITHSKLAESIDPDSPIKGSVQDLTLAQIKELNAGCQFTNEHGENPYRDQGLTVPTLEEAFSLLTKYPQAKFALHLLGDSEGIEQKLVNAVQQHQIEDKVFVAGFNDKQLAKVKSLSGNTVKISAGLEETVKFLSSLVEGKLPNQLPFDVFTAGGQLSKSKEFVEKSLGHATTWARLNKLTDIEIVTACHRYGIPYYIWTSEADEIPKLVDLGIDGAYLNSPRKAREMLDQLKQDPIETTSLEQYDFRQQIVTLCKIAAEDLSFVRYEPSVEEVHSRVERMLFTLAKGERGKVVLLQRQVDQAQEERQRQGRLTSSRILEDIILRAANQYLE